MSRILYEIKESLTSLSKKSMKELSLRFLVERVSLLDITLIVGSLYSAESFDRSCLGLGLDLLCDESRFWWRR